MLSSPDARHYTPDLILVNPAAGSGKARRAALDLRTLAGQLDWNAEIRTANSADELAEGARNALTEGRERLFVVGGDGTFHTVSNAIGAGQSITLAVLPAGGGNDLAMAFGLPPEPVAATKLLLNGRTDFLDAVRVRGADGSTRLYCAGGGVGLDAEAARLAGATYRHAPGRTRYILAALHALQSFRPLNVTARIEHADGAQEIISSRALVVGVLNTPSYGAGVRIAPKALTNDGELDLVLLGDLNFFEVARLLPALIARGEVRTTRLEHRRVKRVKIATDRPSIFHGDGEILGMTPVELEIVPKAFRILRP